MTQLVATNFHASQGRKHTREPGEGGLHPSHPFNVPSLCANFFFFIDPQQIGERCFFKTIDPDAMDVGYQFSSPSSQAQLVVTFPSTVVQGVTCLAAPLS